MNIQKTLATLDETVTVDGTWNGETFTMEVRKNALTPKIAQRFADVSTQPIQMAMAISDIVSSWTIDLDGEEFPTTVENLAILPIDFLNYVVETITEVLVGKSKKQEKLASASAR